MRRDTRLVAGIALAKLGLHLATYRGYGIFRDELYYLACSDHLDWGYVDQPPLSIALLWLVRAALGDSLLAIRLLPALAGAALVLLTGRLARELGGGRGAQGLAALASAVAPAFLALHHIFSMNAFDAVFWAGLALLTARMLATGDPRLWLGFGLVAGLGLQNKYSVAFFALGLGVGLLLSRERRLLASRWAVAGGGLALLLFLPHLLWQVQHGWPSLEFIARARAEKLYPVTPLEFLSGQILLMHPLSVPLWLAGLGYLLFAPPAARFRSLGWAYLVVFALLVVQQAKVYYLAPIYPVLFAAGGVAVERFARRVWRPALPALAGVLAAGGLTALPLAVPVLTPERYIAYASALGVSEPRMERSAPAELPQIFADMHGWRELVETVGRAYRALPPEDRARARVLTGNYGEAGAIDFLGRAEGLPAALSGHNSHHLWGPGDFDGAVALSVGLDEARLREWFREVERVDTVRCRYCMPFENDLPVYVVRDLTLPLDEFWERMRRYM